MPSGEVHRKHSRQQTAVVGLTCVVTCVTLSFTQPDALPAAVVTSTALCLGMHHATSLSPDVDIAHRRSNLARVYWTPFMQVEHRSRWTHSWPRGTFIRWLWTMWLPVSLLLLLTPQPVLSLALLAILGNFLGWSLQDWRHLIDDGLHRRLFTL